MLELRADEGREATNKQDATHTRPVYFQLKLRQEQTHFQQTHKTAGQLWAAYETRAFISMGWSLRGAAGGRAAPWPSFTRARSVSGCDRTQDSRITVKHFLSPSLRLLGSARSGVVDSLCETLYPVSEPEKWSWGVILPPEEERDLLDF